LRTLMLSFIVVILEGQWKAGQQSLGMVMHNPR